MSTKYKGLYIIRNVSNEITDVQVMSGAIDFPLPIGDYEDKGVQPPLINLPEKDEYFKKLNC